MQEEIGYEQNLEAENQANANAEAESAAESAQSEITQEEVEKELQSYEENHIENQLTPFNDSRQEWVNEEVERLLNKYKETDKDDRTKSIFNNIINSLSQMKAVIQNPAIVKPGISPKRLNLHTIDEITRNIFIEMDENFRKEYFEMVSKRNWEILYVRKYGKTWEQNNK